MYLLDTNICIYLIRGQSEVLLKRIQRHKPTDVALSSVTLAELRFGVEKSSYPAKNSQALDLFLLPFEILPFDTDAALTYGRIRSSLESRGTPIGSLDTMIAAHALSIDAVLVTNDQKEFSRVPGLQIENWAR